MIINFPINELSYSEYCPSCHAEDSTIVTIEADRKVFICNICKTHNERLIIIDPKLHWWLDEEKRYCHESAGILLVDPAQRILFYELTKFPYGCTAPAGHVDRGETALAAVIREAQEEVGVDLIAPKLVTEAMIHGDSCRRGSDDHAWSLYMEKVTQDVADIVSVDVHEGQKPRWVDIDEVASIEMPYAMKFLFNDYRDPILRALNTQD
jgi:8-oxo-dGTP pyrophosphatase MutT (NUDIX family)